MSDDLSTRLVRARAVVSTLSEALGLLHDTDLISTVRSPDWQPRVSGSPTRSLPYDGDTGLRRRVMEAMRTSHMAAIALAALDQVEDPKPFDQPPVPSGDHQLGTSLPPLRELCSHLAALDRALSEVQRHRHALPLPDVVVALRACDLLLEEERMVWDEERERWHDRRTAAHRSWERLAGRARRQCVRCGSHAGDSALCHRCLPSRHATSCRNPRQREECRQLVSVNKHQLCSSCYQAWKDQRRTA